MLDEGISQHKHLGHIWCFCRTHISDRFHLVLFLLVLHRVQPAVGRDVSLLSSYTRYHCPLGNPLALQTLLQSLCHSPFPLFKVKGQRKASTFLVPFLWSAELLGSLSSLTWFQVHQKQSGQVNFSLAAFTGWWLICVIVPVFAVYF